MQDLRFLYFILYFCTASNIFFVIASVMGANSNLNKEGVIFDIIYGLGCALNLASDVTMLQALKTPRQAKEKFRLFLIWNVLSTCGCYVTDFFRNNFLSKHVKVEKDVLHGTDEESYRAMMFYSSIITSTVIFLVKGGILYAFYQIYENYDQVVANEEARTSGTRPGLLANSAPVAYRIEQGNQLGVPAMPTAPAFTAPPLGGFQTATPGWSGIPSTTPAWSGMPQAPGQPYYGSVQQPHLPGLQQPVPSTQPQCFSSGGIVYVPYYYGTQPQLTVDQPAIVQGATAEATAGEATETTPDKATAPEVPYSKPGTSTRANSNQEPQAETKPANAALSEDKVPEAPASQSLTPTQAARTPTTLDQDTRTHKVATGEAASADSVYITDAAAQETLPGHKPRRFSSRPSKVAESAPKSGPSGPGSTDA